MTNRESLVATSRELLAAERDLYDGLTAFHGGFVTLEVWTTLARRSNEIIRHTGAALARYTLLVDKATGEPESQ